MIHDLIEVQFYRKQEDFIYILIVFPQYYNSKIEKYRFPVFYQNQKC